MDTNAMERALLEEKVRAILDREVPGYIVVIDDVTLVSYANDVQDTDICIALVRHAAKLVEPDMGEGL